MLSLKHHLVASQKSIRFNKYSCLLAYLWCIMGQFCNCLWRKAPMQKLYYKAFNKDSWNNKWLSELAQQPCCTVHMTISLKGRKWKPLGFLDDHNQIRTLQNSWCSVTQNQSVSSESLCTLFFFTVSLKRFKPAHILPSCLNPCFEIFSFHILITMTATDIKIYKEANFKIMF